MQSRLGMFVSPVRVCRRTFVPASLAFMSAASPGTGAFALAAIKVGQQAAGKFEAPNWDQASQKKKVRDALLGLAATIPNFSKAFYNAAGYCEKNPYDAYSINSITGKKNADGLIAIQFGGCDGKISNCLPVMKGWNYTVRLYRPHPEILSGQWKFPEPQPAS
jgi:hypothetical protein